MNVVWITREEVHLGSVKQESIIVCTRIIVLKSIAT